jgi:O-antigen ligase
MMSVNVFFPKGGPVGYVVNGILLLFILYASVVRNKYNSKFILVYLYLLFTLLLVIFQSSNLLYSITNYIKYTMGLLCLPIGFNLLSSVRKLKEFQKTGIILLVLYLINLVLANVFNWGDYYGYRVERGMDIGNVFADGLYANAYVIVSLFLLLLLFPNKKRLIILLSAINFILIFVNMKRTVILVVIMGLVVYLLFFFFSSRTKFKFAKTQLKYVLIFLLITLFVLPFFYDEIQLRFEDRERTFQQTDEDITNEGRIAELFYISDEIVNADKISTLLLGKETLNFVGTYAEGRFGERQIHGDFAKILHGTGVIGVLIWLFVHLFLVVWIIRMKRKVAFGPELLSYIIFSLFFAFLTMYLLSMLSGVRELVLSSSYFYASIGGFLRYFYNRQFTSRKLIV